MGAKAGQKREMTLKRSPEIGTGFSLLRVMSILTAATTIQITSHSDDIGYSKWEKEITRSLGTNTSDRIHRLGFSSASLTGSSLAGCLASTL